MANLLPALKEERANFYHEITNLASRAGKEAYGGVHRLISHIDAVERDAKAEKERLEANFEAAISSIKKLVQAKAALIHEKEHHLQARIAAETKPFRNLWNWFKSKF